MPHAKILYKKKTIRRKVIPEFSHFQETQLLREKKRDSNSGFELLHYTHTRYEK